MICRLLSATFYLGLTGLLAHTATAQTAQIEVRTRHVQVASGPHANTGDTPAVLFSHVVALPEAADMQLRFGRTTLAEGCTLRLTSLFDGHMQHFNATTLKQWQYYSAWFNGTMVHVELLAEPGAGRSHVTIDGARWTRHFGAPRSICWGTDDRVPSEDPRAARHYPVGCSVWLIDDANHTFLTAGHCVDEGVAGHMAQFNVPLSDSNGNLNHPGPEDQYPFDPVSLQWDYTQIGNDWAYFGCFPNSETGLTPFQAQGASYELADAPGPVKGQDITIIGYGTTSSPIDPQWNQVQKAHTGPFMLSDGTTIGYQTDTTGGNSGSGVLDESTGKAIGIHTNAGCGSDGGYNHGCAIHNAGLQNALANPQGVCVPNGLLISIPGGAPDSVLPGMALEVVLKVEPGEDDPATIMFMVERNGVTDAIKPTPLGDHLYAATIPPLTCGDNVQFHVHATGTSGGEYHHPYSAPETGFPLAVGTIMPIELLSTDFQDGLPGDWYTSGLWHVTTGACSPEGECGNDNSAWFGDPDSCTYDTGAQEDGELASPVVSLDGIDGAIELQYCWALETEQLPDYDYASVRINGQEIHRAGETLEWQQASVDLGSIDGDSVQVSFHFDTNDNLYNAFRGWHVDNVKLVAMMVDCDDTPSCPGDIDGDALVGANDLLMVIADWGSYNSPADIDGDGMVNASDILFILGGWGPC